MRRLGKVSTVVTALSLSIAMTPLMALAATSGTPLDQVYTSATTMISGPMAGLVILFGALAVAVFFMFARGLEGGGLSHAVGWLIGGCIVAAIVTFMPLFFPAAGALIN